MSRGVHYDWERPWEDLPRPAGSDSDSGNEGPDWNDSDGEDLGSENPRFERLVIIMRNC